MNANKIQALFQVVNRSYPYRSYIRAVVSPVLTIYRFSSALSLLIHGFGHALALVLVSGERRYLSTGIVTEGLGFSSILRWIIAPLRGKPEPLTQTPLITNPLTSPVKIRIVASAGSLMNAAAIAAAWWLCPNDALLAQIATALFILTSLLCLSSDVDWRAFVTGKTLAWACGPAFAVRYKLTEQEQKSQYLASERMQQMVEILAKEASTRGGQSAGFAMVANKFNAPSIIFDKVVKGKRQDIVKVLCQRLLDLLNKANREGFKKPGNFEVVLLHLRYATGGATHWHNAQPHWYEHYDSMMHHRVENGQLVSRVGEVFNLIAHNGDMDAVHLDICVDGKQVRHLFTQAQARTVFQAVMPVTTSKGDSDSRSIAEWVDFLLTQGLAYKALRYAYVTRVLDFNSELAQGQFDLEPLQLWADQVDLALLNVQGTEQVLKSRARSINHLNDETKLAVRGALKKACEKEIAPEFLDIFLDAFDEAFFTHDLTWVMRQASRNLVGEFALMACSTLEPRMGVFSLTQAFSIGHNRTRGEIFGSAEPQGVTSSLHSGDCDDDAIQINLEDGQYATVEFEDQHGADAILIYDRVQESDDFSIPAKPSAKALLNDCEVKDSNWFPVNNNPKIDRANRQDSPGEEVNKDIRDIPYVLRRVVDSFKPEGENFQTMEHLSELLFANLTDPERNREKYDLVLYGVDFNQDLITEFALALSSVLPDLKVRAENSGNVLKEMKRNKREGIGRYGVKTVFLGISNSAQTQSTLAAARKAVELVGRERSFVLTQSFLNSMSQSLDQGYHPEDPILPNTFINLSHWSPDGSCGRRRSEAATLVPVATQAVLTEILIGLLNRALAKRPALYDQDSTEPRFEVRHDMQLSDVQAFREFQSAVYEVEIPNRVGFNAAGESIDSPDAESIEQEARARAENHVEFVRSYAVFAAYIIIATLFGVPVFHVLTSPLQSISGVGFIASVLDAALFLCALWLIHLGFRKVQGRPVLERIGARAELYIDRKYIARMIERYNATLFSNAPAFLTPFFYWADTVQDALHRFGIRAHRGVVTIHRTPDERIGVEEANNAAEENMVFAQIGGIRFNFGQPQSRDKVRQNSRYMNRCEQDCAARPYQTVLSDSLEALRQKYQQKLSPETLRLINRRLIDLSDGLVYEFVVGARRRDIINQSLWEIIKWLPGAVAVHHLLLSYGINLKNIIGDADTANQAQIQSTKHPVSPIDISADTMEPRPTVDALISQEQVENDQPFAVLVFYEHCLSVTLNEYSIWGRGISGASEILLHPGVGNDLGKLVSDGKDGQGRFVAVLKRIRGKENLVIEGQDCDFQVAVAVDALNFDQQLYLRQQFGLDSPVYMPTAA